MHRLDGMNYFVPLAQSSTFTRKLILIFLNEPSLGPNLGVFLTFMEGVEPDYEMLHATKC